MTLIDVDGFLPAGELALRGAAEAARAIRRLDIGGSIGIDLPTVGSKAARQEAAAAIDAALPQPFERTAVNGFGFVQIVRPRGRASLVELAQDRAPFEARALLRRAAFETAGPKTPRRSPGGYRRHCGPLRLDRSACRGRSAARSACGRTPSFPCRAGMPKQPDKTKSCPLCGKPERAGTRALLQPRMQGPRPAEMARRRLSHPRAAGRSRKGGQRRLATVREPARCAGDPLFHANAPKLWAQVAQLVEHVTENHGVGGSIPSLGTIAHQTPSLLQLEQH